MKTSFRANALACALLTGTAFCALAAAPAAAQTPREHRALDSNGVDLTHGDFVMAFVEGSIGSGDGELALVRSKVASGNGQSHVGSGGHQWDGIYLGRIVGSSGTSFSVDKDNRYELFSAPGTLPTGSSLAVAGAQHHYRTSDGTLIVFGDPSGSHSTTSNYCNGSWGQGSCYQLPLSITSPNGKSVALQWEVWTSCEDILIDENNPEPDCSYWARLGSVSNSFGYGIAFTYASNGSGSVGTEPPPHTWQRRTGAALYNSHVSTTVPQATTSYSYPSTSIVDVTDTGGRQWRFTGNWPGITAIRRPGAASDTTTVAYSGAGNSVSSVTRDGVTTAYSRSVSGSTATMTVTNALNQSTTIVSDLTVGRPTSVTNALNQTTGFQYDSGNRLKRVTAPEGNYVEHDYDSRGNVIQTVAVPKGGSGPTIVTSATYDSACSNPATCNRPASTTDARGNVTDYTYDPTHGGVLTVTAPAPTPGAVRPQTRYSYTLTDGEYRLTGISQCRTSSACTGTADEVKTALAYDPNGNVHWTATGSGDGALVASSTMTYDPAGNLETVDGPLPGSADTSRVRYNSARQVVGAVSPDPDGAGPLKHRAVRNTYDSATGLPAKVEQGNVNGQSDSDWAAFAPAQAVETVYDGNARPVVSKLTSGSTVHSLGQTSYDPLGRPECSAERMNPAEFGSLPASACSLDTEGNDGPDRITKAIYDAAGRVAQVQTALGTADAANEVTTTYTANGQVQTATDGENNKTTYEYDGHDRLSKTYFPLPAKGAGTSNASDYAQLTYESLGGGARTSALTVAFRNRAGQSIGFGHDSLGRQTSKDLPGSEPDVAYAYDLLGQLTGASQAGHGLTFAYDALGRKLSETGPLGTMASAWDLAGRRTRITHPDGFFVDQDYLVTGEVTAVRENGATSGAGVLATYGYDDLGRRVSLMRGNGASTSYAYDSASRLASLGHDLGGTGADVTLSFGFNPASQISSNSRSNDAYAWAGHGSGTSSSNVNGLNQLTASGSGSRSHDSKGNTVFDGATHFAYSSENLLTSQTVTSASPSWLRNATFGYDPAMRLYETGSGTSSFRWLYDGWDLAVEYNGSGALLRRDVRGPGGEHLVTLVPASGGTTRYWSHSDERGSYIRGSKGDGTADTAQATTYDEYGRQGGAWSVFGIGGERYMLYTDLIYLRHRAYNPADGRFMQPDPTGYGDGMNMYAYVGGDPVNFTDPLGLKKDNEDEEKETIFVNGILRGGAAATASLMGATRTRGGITDCNNLGCIFTPDIIVTGYQPNAQPPQPAQPVSATSRRINYCQIGNDIMYVSDKAGDASLALTATGLSVALIGGIGSNPGVIAGGAAVSTAGGVIGLGAGGLQVVGGLAQGAGGGGYKNAVAGAVSLGTGVVVSKVLRASIPRGWHGTTRDTAKRNNSIAGNVVGALMSFSDWLAPTQVECPK